MVDNIQKVQDAVAALEKVKEHISHLVFHFRKNDETKIEKEERIRQKERELFDATEKKRMQNLLVKFLAQARASRSEALYSNTNMHESAGWELLASPHVSVEAKRLVRGYMPEGAARRGVSSGSPEVPIRGRFNREFFEVPSGRHPGEVYVVPAHQTIHSPVFGL